MEFKHGIGWCICGVWVLSVPVWAAAPIKSAPKESPIKVVVSGAPPELADNLKAYLPSLRNLNCESSLERLQRFVDASHSKLVEGAEAVGYFSAGFKLTPVRAANCWVLNLDVEPGTPVRVTESNIQLTGPGSNLPLFSKLVASNPYEPGEILVSQKYEDLKSNLKRLASRLGFFDAVLEQHEIVVDIDTKQAVINLHFATGPRYQMGEVTVQQDVLAQKYIDRYIRLEQGEPFDSNELLNQQRLLEGSGYYKDVRITTRYRDAKDNQVPVEITAIRRKRYSYTANLGYATDTGARFEAAMETHWLNNKGHKLDSGMRVSQNELDLRATYKVPLWKPEHEFASLSGGWNQSDNGDIKSDVLNLELNYNRRNKEDWQQTAFINFLNEDTEVSGQESVRSQLTLIGARVSKKEANEPIFPTQGWRAQAEIKGSHDALLSDQSLLQLSAQTRYLQTFDKGNKIIAQGNVGTTVIDELASMPKSLRFFAGGQNSIRGYDFESIGEQDSEGNVIGGKHVLTLSAEYEHPVAEKISAAVFVDAGSAFDAWDTADMKVGAGIGARYKSPLGPVRVDLAVPEDNTSDVHVYFSLGPDL